MAVARNGEIAHKATYLNEQKQQRKGARLARDRLVKVAQAGLQYVTGLFSKEGSSQLGVEASCHFALAVSLAGGDKAW